jgi:Holliday junction DNA helicase RuvB
MQIGLLARTSRGRQLTVGAWEHLGLAPPASATSAQPNPQQPGLFD